ncbi:nicotinate-nucleotide adenylyltransferase [Betaproteobacteria bacterium PRO7]|jgi:nicotinate-nucleotide adenylyltransferase|nr:nicotinate-nucleotide adenylyltransferase [Betaproteobacteria bacterium PRO7]
MIGLLGGSFDPIHVGHLALARAALERLGLAELRFIPAGHPWQKGEITDATHRAKMVALAIAGEPRFVLDMHEIERSGPSYTIDTLRALRATLGSGTRLVLVLGADQMERIDTWRDWRHLLDFAHIAVARRNDAVLTLPWPLQEFYNEHWARPAQLRDRPAGCIVDLEMAPVDASATEIRALLHASASPARDARLAQIVPAAVLDYIRAHDLYR